MQTIDDIRDEREAELLAILAQLDIEHRKSLIYAIERYGRVQNIPEVEWQQLRNHTEDRTVHALFISIVAADRWTTQEIRRLDISTRADGGRDRLRYAVAAASRARRMADVTVQTIRDRLSRRIETELASGPGGVGELTSEGIEAAVDEVLTDSRAEAVAVTETTGALTDGQRGAADRANEANKPADADDGGIPGGDQAPLLGMLWQTERDNKVCSRCAPLQDQPESVWSKVFPNGPGQDAHVNCRCWLKPVAK